MKQSRRRTALLFTALGIVAILLLLVDMATGDTFIPISKIGAILTGGECDETTRNIILSIRFIRVIVAALIGIALSVSGLQMQTIFQNPLADPYLLGVSSGAGLGVALFIFQRPFLLLFTSDDAVIHYGQIRIGVMAFVYCVSAFMDNATAAARGIGKSIMPTIIVVMGSVVFRIIWLLTVFAYFKTLQSLYLIYVISWTLTAIAGNIYFAYHYKRI